MILRQAAAAFWSRIWSVQADGPVLMMTISEIPQGRSSKFPGLDHRDSPPAGPIVLVLVVVILNRRDRLADKVRELSEWVARIEGVLIKEDT